MEFWGKPPEIYGLSIQSPTGEILEVSRSIGSRTQELSFVFVETKVYVNYILIERQTGYSLVYLHFCIRRPVSGKFYPGKKPTERTVPYMASCGRADFPGYLFSKTSPLSTVTAPGDARNSITATAYQHRDGSIYIAAGRGYTPDGMITPHLAAPGVNVKVPLVRGGFEPAPEPVSPPHRPLVSRHFCLNGRSYGITSRFFTGSSVKYYL